MYNNNDGIKRAMVEKYKSQKRKEDSNIPSIEPRSKRKITQWNWDC